MKNNVRKNLGSDITGSMYNAAFKANFPLAHVEIFTCSGCCQCVRRGLVETFVYHQIPNMKTRGFAIVVTMELATRTSGRWVAEQIVNLLQSESCPVVEEAQPLKSIDIWEETNAAWAELERKAAELDAEQQMIQVEPDESSRQLMQKSATRADGSSRFS